MRTLCRSGDPLILVVPIFSLRALQSSNAFMLAVEREAVKTAC